MELSTYYGLQKDLTLENIEKAREQPGVFVLIEAGNSGTIQTQIFGRL